MDQQLLQSQIFVTDEQFNNNDCSVVEGCVTKAGKHTLLRFNSSTPNIGQADLVIGDPAQCLALFHLSECHQHYHFNDYTAYRLWTEAGYLNWAAARDPGAPANTGINAQLLAAAASSGELIDGRKQGFCMVDSSPYREVQDPNPEARDSMRVLIGRARENKQFLFLFVNNRLEGNAPETIRAVVE